MSELKRSPLKRTEFKPSEPKPVKGKKKRKCKICRAEFEPISAWAKACSTDCAEQVARQIAAEKKAKGQRQERAKDKVKREAMKDYWDLIGEAQTAVNAYVRWRDRGKPCIDCGKPFEEGKIGGSMDAGHFLSRGSAPHLRFNLDNIHGQRKNCNRPGGATRHAYREGLIARIGLERVEALESNNETMKWTHDELRSIRDTFRLRLKKEKKESL